MANLRVTQAGRQAAVQDTEELRVTQAGRDVALNADAALRVTLLGRNVLVTEPIPSRPPLYNPVQSGTYSSNLAILYGESTDPLGETPVYYARLKLTTDTVWTDIFTARSGTDQYNYDISGLTDGTYNFELWAQTPVGGASSSKNTLTFTIHNGIPTEPEITSPYEGEKWQKTTNSLEWNAATDPDMDSLVYYGRYQAVGATSWTSLFGPQAGLTYSWDTTSLAVGDYVVEVWANDGDGDGPADQSFFSIFIADQPAIPRIRIVEVGKSYVTAELDAYSHPFSRPWQATDWEMIPFGGDWSNPVVNVETTDSTEQLLYTFSNLPPGFMGMIRARFQDNASTWGGYCTEAFFQIPENRTGWYKKWERNATYTADGLGLEMRAGDWSDLGPGYHEQPVGALVDPDAERIGSAFIEGYMMAGGCYCGWIGTDTELQVGGIGLFYGDSVRGGETGVMFGLDYGTKAAFTGISGGHYAKPYSYAQFSEDCNAYSGSPPAKTVRGDQFIAYSQVIAGVTPLYGQPIGPWLTEYTHFPVYKVELWIQRDVSLLTSRIRGRINYAGWYDTGLPEAYLDRKAAAGDQWDIDYTFPCLTVCGFPGFWRRQFAYAWESSFIQYFGLRWKALRDDGLEVAYNRDALTPYVEPTVDTCTPVAEDALPAPVFFPCPPNGNVEEEWVHPSDVITSRDETEQRISLRDIPAERISWLTTLPTSRELGAAKALIWEEQPSRWGVPLWMDAATLTTDLAASSGTIPTGYFDASGRRFEEMDYVAIWTDQFTWDFLPATLNSDGSITLTGTTSQAFVAHATQIIPCRIGRMMPSADFDRDAPEIGDFRVTFVLEAVDNG